MTVAELLKDPARFAKGVEARDSTGQEVGAEDPQAQSWCLLAAVYRCYPEEARLGVMDKLYLELFGMDSDIPFYSGEHLTLYNDDPRTSAQDVADLASRAGV